MRLVVYDTAGRIVSDTAAACQNFSMRVGLYQGSYTATATMLDPSGSPRTTTINLQPFTVVADTTLVLDTDFPRNSFF